MKKSALSYLILVLFSFTIFSCSDEYTKIDESPVIMDLSLVPYPKLSDYLFFEGNLNNQQPSYGVLPYKPTSELFSDYAKKKRFIWLPDNTIATYTADHEILNLPVGAALIKTFYYSNVQPSLTEKIIETRVMIRQNTGWIFANYIWNDEQTEAYLQMEGGTVPIEYVDGFGSNHVVNYEIPSEDNCFSCHSKAGEVHPIGIKPQNLNSDFNYSDGNQNQLSKLIEFGYLENSLPETISSVVDYNDPSQTLDLRVRSYFDINCAHCHQDGGIAAYLDLRMPFNLTSEAQNMGVCVGTPSSYPGISHGMIVKPNDVSQSVLHFMMNTNNTFYRMPRLGRTVVHEEAITLVSQWINSLPECE